MVKNVLMRDVANLAGVSSQTVSRVLSGKTNVSDSTKHRVLQAVEALGYRPNRLAASLASGESSLVGVLRVGHLSYGRAQSYIHFERIQNSNGLYVVSASVDYDDRDDWKRGLDYLQSIRLRALVIMSQNVTIAQYLNPLLRQPTVLAMNEADASCKLARVELEQLQSMEKLLAHLYSLGCRRIVHISPEHNEIDANLRRQAYLDFCEVHDLEPFVLKVPDWSSESGTYAAQQLSTYTFDAISAANDWIALGVSTKLFNCYGMLAGRDYALTGYDDTDFAPYVSPALTTVRQDYTQLAISISAQIDSLLSDKKPGCTILENTLVIRESTLNYQAAR
ncbi:LacI family DNA-binding transcriptional regulator [Mobiluncus mulieris]|nr:LacI family DNA-binding transcriptional regulator [Mobiluncus mulieris]